MRCFAVLPSFFRLLALLLLPLLLPSCLKIHVNESVSLNKDGSGTMQMQYSLPMSEDLGKKTGEFLKELTLAANNTKGILSFSSKNSGSPTQPNLLFSIQFEHLRALTKLKDSIQEIAPRYFPESSSESVSKALFDISWKIKGLTTIEISRPINLPPAGNNGEAFYGDSALTFMYSLPEPPAYSNAHHTSQDGTLLIWKFKPSEFKKGDTPSIVFTLSPWYILPQNTLAGLAGILLGLIAGLVYGLIRRKKRGQKKQLTASSPNSAD